MNRKVAPSVGMDMAGCAFGCNRVPVSKTDSWDPFSVASTNAVSPEANAICVGRPGRGMVACG
jgi:hypothetical protein